VASERNPGNSIPGFLGSHLALLKKHYSFSGYERDLVVLNLDGRKFLDISGLSGADSLSDGRAAVYVDYDDDGDLDIFLRAMHGEAHYLFRNDAGQQNNWLRVSLTGTKSGRDAYGATVRVKTSHGILTRLKAGGEGFVSQRDPRLLFGLGRDPRVEWVEVTWPSGTTVRLPGAKAGTHLRITEPAGR